MADIMEEEAAAAKVKSIFIYPVKSCRGISVSQASISSTGFRWDRQWLVVNSRGRGYTQRVEPKLALIEVELPTDAFSPGWEPNTNSFLVIRAVGMNTLKIPVVEPHEKANAVSVWEWSGSAFDEGEEASKWFTDFLGKPCRLVRFDEESETRPVDREYARNYKVKFNDLYQFLILSQGSLDALNDRLEQPVLVNRFRPNILVDGCESFAEDFWREIKINDSTFLGHDLCHRCKVPTVNQETAEVGAEPTKTLMKFRSDKKLRPNDEKHQGRVYLGKMLVCKI
ncbi:mitochondrial amidoxime reducing component 2-like [Olea europaea subsp. europaea]|uniref:Mitochondrial amidoxime reducing component 2-like n=1 Tax=Olea europaea subsp. europaea TaxID=158383 RepID=A0A8S0UI98_OLEEU|nr:mitochondrial amidoxime reducing component 2-like [Olea europaea subsp. europaea]